ncbi:hypothetical protein [Candidatus Ornithobacterium hominis]|uniref:hypothetical protein n=1 Tax=Candidatus Ornithobacterium hominis TaxID=2497989 RepID=UPI0014027FC6|nr:hypothetical protein [Candidatus Ornithobacterium hominis]
MNLFGYKPTKLGWVFIFSLLISFINPLAFGIVLGLWFGYGVLLFAKKCYDSAVHKKD